MRSLNKIVFINSAHIRYAEVAMDGNVHFTGTQGVGKTTLLRALLFFYNCRKDRLGIRMQGQQSFDEFYVPTSSSYIVYEVSRGEEEPAFSIILFRHKNKAAFRFVDAPYSKEWFIDGLGMVASENLTVRQRIQSQGIDFSGIIERYAQYLDILYGNRAANLPKGLLKYYLLKSQQYQNIPRIIQNVFLNERVDAGFIKNIIINSITGEDEEIAVDLNFFRAKLIHFNDEMRDISLWTEKDRHGIVETRRDADKIIDISHEIKAARFSLVEQCGMLNYAMLKAERDIPLLQSRIAKKAEAINQLDEKIRKISYDFDQDQKKINDRIAVLSRDLKKAAERKKEYQRIGIDDMIARAGKLPMLNLELMQKERLQSQLSDSHRSISDKYRMLKDRMDVDKKQYLHDLSETKNTVTGDFNNRQAERLRHRSKLESEIRNEYDRLLAENEENLGKFRDLLHEQEMLRLKASSSSPMKDEIAACERNIADLGTKMHLLTEEKLKAENQLDAVRNKFELDCRQIETETALKIKEIEAHISLLETQRSGERAILDKAQGSLCEWLDANVEGWEKTIGKVADERTVLYAQNLHPRFADDRSATLYGISIDLESIDKEVRTPSMIREAIGILDKETQACANEIIKLREEKDLRIAEGGKEIRSRIKSMQTEIDTIFQNIHVCQRQEKEEALRLDSLKEEDRIRLEEIIRNFDENIRESSLKVENLKRERSAIEDRRDKELRRVGKTIAEEEKADRIQHDARLESISNDIARYSADHENKLKQLEMDEAAELSHSGADIRMLESVKKEISDIKAMIARIDMERDKITCYRKDCEELLDHVAAMQFDKKKFEEDAARLHDRYEERRNKHENKKREELQSLSAIKDAYTKAVESKRGAEDFIMSNACPHELKETAAIPTDLLSTAIISTIKDLDITIRKSSDELKKCINEFQNRFSANNTFKFPISLITVDDYHRYAESLEDFVTNDKIKDFQQVTSNLYRDILSRAANDFSILLARESEIRKIIRDINYDFEKKTFAGVIRKIELRLERSTMPVITQLHNITEFWNTHHYELGEINLFSSELHADINREATKYLRSLSSALTNASELKKLPLDLTFALQFQITENDNSTDWVENIRAVGSEGTDILVKAIINILLISVFKKRAGQAGDFRLHCMMDEIGRLADENIQGILNFANQRGIYIVNSSPKAHRPLSYRRLYMLSKDNKANTIVQPILSIREAELL